MTMYEYKEKYHPKPTINLYRMHVRDYQQSPVKNHYTQQPPQVVAAIEITKEHRENLTQILIH